MRGSLLAISLFGSVAACAASTVPPTDAPPPAEAAAPPSPDAIDAPSAAADEHHHHGPLVRRFEDAERWARQFDDPERDAWQKPDEVVSLLRITPGMTVADIGAGTGYFEGHLAKAVGPEGEVLALDVEEGMIAYLTERARREGWDNVRPSLVPFDDPKLPADSVDRILIVDTWHHIPGRPAYSKKLRDALTDGGFVMVVDFTMETSHGPPKAHRVPPDAVVAELTEGGLDTEVVAETLPDQYVVIGKRQ